jgi:hypothetical protein
MRRMTSEMTFAPSVRNSNATPRGLATRATSSAAMTEHLAKRKQLLSGLMSHLD